MPPSSRPTTSVIGPKRTSHQPSAMSAFEGKADIDLTLCNMSVLAMRKRWIMSLSHDRLDFAALLQRNSEIAKFVRQFRERGRCGAKSNWLLSESEKR